MDTVRVAEPVPVANDTVVGAIDPVRPSSQPIDRSTVPVYPLRPVRLIAEVPVPADPPPWGRVSADGLALIEKLGPTLSITKVELTSFVLLPRTKIEYVLGGVAKVVVMVRVDVAYDPPVTVTLSGLRDSVSKGKKVDRDTSPANPPVLVTLTVVVAEEPIGMERLLGSAARVKPGPVTWM